MACAFSNLPPAAFLMQANPPAFSFQVIVLSAYGDDGADAGEGEGHHADQRWSRSHLRRIFVLVQRPSSWLMIEAFMSGVFVFT